MRMFIFVRLQRFAVARFIRLQPSQPLQHVFDQKPLFMLFAVPFALLRLQTFTDGRAYLLPFLCTQTLATFISNGFKPF